jgi:hypothetical protein
MGSEWIGALLYGLLLFSLFLLYESFKKYSEGNNDKHQKVH